MAIEDYYFTRQAIPGLGKLLFLKVLQAADSSGGGESLRGSVVQEAEDRLLGIFPGPSYPIPMHMSAPRVVHDAIDAHREVLGISGPIVLEVELAASQQSIRIEQRKAYQASIAPFPALPVNLALDVDYARMRNVELSFGEGTRLRYIPLGYLGRLYQYLEGEHRPVVPSGALAENNVVDAILLARSFEVLFESEEAFHRNFDAKLEALRSLRSASAEVRYEKVEERRVVARVDSGRDYLVALHGSDWDAFDLD